MVIAFRRNNLIHDEAAKVIESSKSSSSLYMSLLTVVNHQNYMSTKEKKGDKN
jgi:hypothetical protein